MKKEKKEKKSAAKGEVEQGQSELAQRQVFLIQKLQAKSITDEENCELVASFGGIVVNIARNYKPSFAQDTDEELQSDGNEALICALNSYDVKRGAPSTYFHHVINRALAKKWWKNRVRCASVKTDKIDPKTKRYEKLRLPNKSLDQCMQDHGELRELGRETSYTGRLVFQEQLQRFYDRCCYDELTYVIMNTLFSLVRANGDTSTKRQVKEVFQQVADKVGVDYETVCQVIQDTRDYIPEEVLAGLQKYGFTCPEFKYDNSYTDAELHEVIAAYGVDDVVELMKCTGHLPDDRNQGKSDDELVALITTHEAEDVVDVMRLTHQL